MPWDWMFAQIITVGRSAKVAKMMVVRWRLTFLTTTSRLLPYAFVWGPYFCMGKMLSISNDFSSEAARQMLPKFHAELPWGGGTKDCFLKCSRSIDQDGRHAHICYRPLKSASSKPSKPPGLIFAQIIGGGRSTKIDKMIVLRWCLTFLWQCQPCICMGPVH